MCYENEKKCQNTASIFTCSQIIPHMIRIKLRCIKTCLYHFFTLLQIQFCCTLSHTVHSMSSPCDFPPWGQYLLAGYMLLMLVLFTNFYIMSYVARRKTKSDHIVKNGDSARNGTAVQNGSGIKSKKQN